MNKNLLKGILLGIVISILIAFAFAAIYDYCPNVARLIWSDYYTKFKNIPIHEDSIFDENDIVGEIPLEQFSKTHVCEIWDGEPTQLSGLFTYDFDTETWIWCQ